MSRFFLGNSPQSIDVRGPPKSTHEHRPGTQIFAAGPFEEESIRTQSPFQPNGKALGLGDYAGFVKIVVDEKYGEILGAHMIGPEVTELLPELTLAHMMELTAHEIARNVHAHPTLSEVLMEAAHGAEGSPIHM